MAESKRPLSPVKPAGVEIIFLYPCPFCKKDIPLISPTQPAMAQCDACRRTFPIVPVDDKALKYFRIMTRNGAAGIDPDFL